MNIIIFNQTANKINQNNSGLSIQSSADIDDKWVQGKVQASL